MAREGLRTLVVGKKVLSEDQLSIFNVSLTTVSFEKVHEFDILTIIF